VLKLKKIIMVQEPNDDEDNLLDGIDEYLPPTQNHEDRNDGGEEDDED
jgi:hypothetical protein